MKCVSVFALNSEITFRKKINETKAYCKNIMVIVFLDSDRKILKKKDKIR